MIYMKDWREEIQLLEGFVTFEKERDILAARFEIDHLVERNEAITLIFKRRMPVRSPNFITLPFGEKGIEVPNLHDIFWYNFFEQIRPRHQALTIMIKLH